MNIRSNGSTWAGQEPYPLASLFTALETETLDPTFEKYGNFVLWCGDGKVRVWGNFETVSHVFEIDGTLQELLPLCRAIKTNKRTERYARARGRLITMLRS